MNYYYNDDNYKTQNTLLSGEQLNNTKANFKMKSEKKKFVLEFENMK